MRLEEHSGLLTVLVALAVAIAAYLSMAGGYPSPSSPHSFAVVMPGLVLWSQLETVGAGWVEFLAYLVLFCFPMALLCFVWLRGLRRGAVQVPLRSWLLLGLTAVLVPIHLATSWEYGVEYQGRSGTAGIAAEAVIGLVAVLVLAMIAARKPSFTKSLVFHASLFLFLAWCAFPWLGETM
jgi:hypothetical protein